MDYKDLIDKIEIFREKSENGKLVIFVGAGVSCNVEGMPSWNGLVTKMGEAINYKKCDICKHKINNCDKSCLFKNVFSAEEYLKIPQYVYNKDKKTYEDVLKNNIMHPDTDASLSSAIFDINPKHIITTNYDTLLESSKNDFVSQYQVIVKDKDLLNSNRSKYIVKMHGDISDIDTIVLKEEDYLSFSQNHVLIELFVKSLLVDHTVLFLGYSLNDYNVKLIINWINYMRIQNGSLSVNQKIGYIVLDVDHLDENEIEYFSTNQIGVININKMKLLDNIPDDLTDVRGKRLYSFLRIIADPSLDKSAEYIAKIVLFLSKFDFVELKNILELLHIKMSGLKLGELIITNNDDFDLLDEFFNSRISEAETLKQLLKKTGIQSIIYNGINDDRKIAISKEKEDSLEQCEFYKLYVENNFAELNKILESKLGDWDLNKKKFYLSLLGVVHLINQDEMKKSQELNNSKKLALLYNEAAVNGLVEFSFQSQKVKNFIKNISSLKERKIFNFYINMFAGNDSEKLMMKSKLEKLNETTGYISSIFSEIQTCAYSQYYVYFYNGLYFKGYWDLSRFMEIYIEAIFSMNQKRIQKDNFLGFNIPTDRYNIGKLDIDIITKFISSKKILELIDKYNVDNINILECNIDFLTNCFSNLVYSMVDLKMYGYRKDFFQTINNIAIILTKVTLSEDNIELIKKSVVKFFYDTEVVNYFFSVENTERNESLKIFEQILDIVKLSNDDLSWIKILIKNKNFWQYSVNVNRLVLRKFIKCFLPEKLNKNQQIELSQIIDNVDSFEHKLSLLSLVFKEIDSLDIIEMYSELLSSKFDSIKPIYLFDFVFNNWLKITDTQKENLIDNVIDLYNTQIENIRPIPNPLDIKLESIYILYIKDIIQDISKLECLKKDRPHLQFLLNPDDFDYQQVDFSNYMWMNFVRYKRFRDYFIKNKEYIIPKIKEKINYDMATEDEKKILYRFLLGDNEIW